MAGSYPDAPGRRMAYDADGTVVGHRRPAAGTPLVEHDGSFRARGNDEETAAVITSNVGENSYMVFIFPELRELDGIYIGGIGGVQIIEDSEDTTNGTDGTWATVVGSPPARQTPVIPTYRTQIQSVARNAKRALRWLSVDYLTGLGESYYATHIYGTISPGETPDRLLWLDEATGLEFTADLDLGDVPRGGSEDVELRLKNNSATFTIETIQYTAEALYLDAGSWWTFTLPSGATFQATRQIASIAPDTTTGVITARRITPADEDLGLHAARFRVTHTALT